MTVTLNAKISVAPAGGWNVLGPADLGRLKATKICPGCRLYGAGLRSEDLTGANLSGAIMPDYRICNDNSIGECI
ncbi:MAG: hypothetical protein IH610_06525 [Deltaproteobacteria bacterium]|nr:hypothetical protein [Deltaproteobacteria bacterium]